MRKILFLFFTLMFMSVIHGQTAQFEKRFLTTSGSALIGATINLVPQDGSYPADTLRLTEHPTRLGWYYRTSVPLGEYKIYINGSLYTQNIFHGSAIWTNSVIPAPTTKWIQLGQYNSTTAQPRGIYSLDSNMVLFGRSGSFGTYDTLMSIRLFRESVNGLNDNLLLINKYQGTDFDLAKGKRFESVFADTIFFGSASTGSLDFPIFLSDDANDYDFIGKIDLGTNPPFDSEWGIAHYRDATHIDTLASRAYVQTFAASFTPDSSVTLSGIVDSLKFNNTLGDYFLMWGTSGIGDLNRTIKTNDAIEASKFVVAASSGVYDVTRTKSLTISASLDRWFLSGDLYMVGNLSIDTDIISVDGVAAAGNTGKVLRSDGTGYTPTSLSASDIASGTFATARLGSGTASATTFLKGNQTWSAISATTDITTGTLPTSRGGTGTTSFTASRAIVSDGSGNLTASSITSTQIGYLSGVAGTIMDLSSTQTITGTKTFGTLELNNALGANFILDGTSGVGDVDRTIFTTDIFKAKKFVVGTDGEGFYSYDGESITESASISRWFATGDWYVTGDINTTGNYLLNGTALTFSDLDAAGWAGELTADPSNVSGKFYYNTVSSELRFYTTAEGWKTIWALP